MKERKQNKSALWGGVLFLLTVVGLVAFAGVKINAYLKDEQQAPVQVIHFSGSFTYVDVAKLETLIRRSQPGSFFSLDVNEVFKLLESQPWVYRASVRKQWPNRLNIYVVEQTPVARWNGDLILNPYGETFNPQGTTLALPSLYGPGGSEKTALEGYNTMQALLSTMDMQIAELSLSERFAWQVQLNSGVTLNLGRQAFIDRVQRFIDIYPLLMQQEKAVNYVDLRYDTGVAVGWDNDEDSTQNEES